MRKVQPLNELKHAKKNLEYLMGVTIPSRVMVGLPGVEYHIAFLQKPKIVIEDKVIIFRKSRDN